MSGESVKATSDKGSSVRVTVLGAARTVTGSKYLVETDRHKLLVDCGLFQGKKDLRLRNWEKPAYDAASIQAVVLTHAHIDHTGHLPLLVKQGFRGPIYATSATIDLVKILLPDSGRLQEEEAAYANKVGSSKHQPARPLYTEQDALKTLLLLRELETAGPTEVLPGVRVFTANSGHILGSVSLSLELGGRRVTFSGDVGRYNTPILSDPQGTELGDLLFCESTYGNRTHELTDTTSQLGEVITKVLERKGPLIIPAFAVGRVQHLIYVLAQLEREGKIPELPVFVDSPMAVDVTAIYRKHQSNFDKEAQTLLDQGVAPLLTARLAFCQSVEQSKKLNFLTGPRIIIAASGMVNGGRIMHHMSQWLDREETTVLFVGYQAEGTRGRLIQSGAKEVKFFGRYVPVRAKVETISGLSAHGDSNELVRWLKSSTGSPSSVKISHGEAEASNAFASIVTREFDWQATPAEHGEVVVVS